MNNKSFTNEFEKSKSADNQAVSKNAKVYISIYKDNKDNKNNKDKYIYKKQLVFDE